MDKDIQMMNNKYSIKLYTPEGNFEASSNSLSGLKKILFDEMPILFGGKEEGIPSTYIDKIFVKIISNEPQRPFKIVQDGYEKELISCFLLGKNIPQTIKWFEDNKKYNCSRSAVHRYFQMLRRHGVLPTYRKGLNSDLKAC